MSLSTFSLPNCKTKAMFLGCLLFADEAILPKYQSFVCFAIWCFTCVCLFTKFRFCCSVQENHSVLLLVLRSGHYLLFKFLWVCFLSCNADDTGIAAQVYAARKDQPLAHAAIIHVHFPNSLVCCFLAQRSEYNLTFSH
jgi:hypothetical protein